MSRKTIITASALKPAAKNYRLSRDSYGLDTHIKHTMGLHGHFGRKIEAAALAIDNRNKIHSHQRRVGKAKLKEFAQKLLSAELEIKKAKSFDELYNTLRKHKPSGVGELTVYDTALRIGYSKGNKYLPDKIYLHTGTRKGAKMLIPLLGNRSFIYKSELPKGVEQFRPITSRIRRLTVPYFI